MTWDELKHARARLETYEMKTEDLIRLRDALVELSEAIEDNADVPTQWACNNDGTWSPVFPDGRTGGGVHVGSNACCPWRGHR